MLPAFVDADRARAVMHCVMPDFARLLYGRRPWVQHWVYSSLERAWRVSGAAEESYKTVALLMSIAVALLANLTVNKYVVSKHRG